MRVQTVWLTGTVLLALGAAPGVARAVPLAPLPGTTGAETAKPGTTVPNAGSTAGTTGTPSPAERLSRGVVTVEREGHILGVGSVLSGDGDGRILTSLSPLGGTETADVRYADGSMVHAKVGHRDKGWDLALLVPLSGKWTDGLVASGSSPEGVMLQAPVANHQGRPVVVAAHVRGVIDARAKEGNAVLPAVLDVELQPGSAPTLGAPVIDATGGVVGVFVRACQAALPTVAPLPGVLPPGTPPPPGTQPATAPAPVAAAPCVPIIVAAPMQAIREFLSHTPATAVVPSAWLGIVGAADSESYTHGVRVMAIAPESPAHKAGLKASDDRTQADLIVAVDGQPVDSPERLAEIISRHAIGEHVKLLLLSGGKFHESTLVLRAAP